MNQYLTLLRAPAAVPQWDYRLLSLASYLCTIDSGVQALEREKRRMEHQQEQTMEESAEGKIITVNDNTAEEFKPDCYNLDGDMGADAWSSTRKDELSHTHTARKIGKELGVVTDWEEPTVDNVLARTFLRARVSINVCNPLTTGIWLNREKLPKVWVELKYERIHDCFCINCGIIGHNKKECRRSTVMSILFPNKPRFTPGLGVNKAKSLQALHGRKWRNWSSTEEEGDELAREEQSQAGGGGADKQELKSGVGKGSMGRADLEEGADWKSRAEPYLWEREVEEQVEGSTFVQQIKAGNQGFNAEQIEEDFGRIIQYLKKGKAVVAEEDNGPGVIKEIEEDWKENNMMEIEPNQANQSKQGEKDQNSDEATSLLPQELTLRDGSKTIEEV
ncbi:hypothetical protein PIB30_054011 [Stylosanthes scabra]|uniref:CCHC-type domain-containing protein n=1 Tax=Stylosanthes scabra TaxID=79078 RepID=A0ABU6WJ56_9FABA|nr:hypothetical protein [Stylosanthes scabra]